MYLVEIHLTAQILAHANNLKILFSSIRCANTQISTLDGADYIIRVSTHRMKMCPSLSTFGLKQVAPAPTIPN